MLRGRTRRNHWGIGLRRAGQRLAGASGNVTQTYRFCLFAFARMTLVRKVLLLGLNGGNSEISAESSSRALCSVACPVQQRDPGDNGNGSQQAAPDAFFPRSMRGRSSSRRSFLPVTAAIRQDQRDREKGQGPVSVLSTHIVHVEKGG